MLGVICRCAQNGIARVFGEVDAVLAPGQILVFVEIFRIVRAVVMAGIDEPEFAIVFNGAAGEAAIVFFVRAQSHRQRFPMEHVPAAGMPQMHGPPLGGIGIILVEDMVISLKEAEAVGQIVKCGFQGLREFAEKGMGNGRHDDADGFGPLQRKVASHLAGNIIQFFDCSFHLLAGLFGNIAFVVEH